MSEHSGKDTSRGTRPQQESRAKVSHVSDTLNRALIKTWHDLCVSLGHAYTISEAAVIQLLVARMLGKGYLAEADLCPEDYYLDREGGWRRVDLLIGKDLLFETGKPRAIRGRLLSAAVEFKVESEAVTIRLPQIEKDAAKLQGLAEDQQERSSNFNVLVFFRSKQCQRGQVPAWKEMSSLYRSVRFVVSFSEEGEVRVLHFHQGRVRDISRSDGHFYKGWQLDRALARDQRRATTPRAEGDVDVAS
ncbi:hypothetical protein TA3x_005583 [Tundrisphaera sp. TA3]|uniref:hypothetical protein n=1 Tax=Tundrisphaera sp. TA3 TaxID=3435775 RepID=UPI003EB71267